MKEDYGKIEEKLSLVKYKPDSSSHISIDTTACKNCESKVCTFVCPAAVYSCEGEELKVEYENCLECGACKVACEGVDWQYPASGKGVVYKFS